MSSIYFRFVFLPARYFLNCPTSPETNPKGRSQGAASLRYQLKQCRSASRLLALLEQAVSEEKMEASVIGAAMQTCGYRCWWGTFLKVRAIQQEQAVLLFTVQLSIALTALAHCLKQGGKFGALQQRKLEVFAMARDIWQEVTATDKPTGTEDFNCSLSSAVKLARCVDTPEAREWGIEVWRQADATYRKSIITFGSYVHFLEHYKLRDEVDAILAEESLETNCVVLGSLLDSAASWGDTARANHLWDLFVNQHGVSPNLLCHNAFAKAFLISGHPTLVTQILGPVVETACSEEDFNVLSTYVQSLLVVYQSSLAVEHLNQLLPLLEKEPPPRFAREWQRFAEAVQSLRTGS